MCWADPNKGSMKGIVTHVDAKVHIRSIGQHHLQLQNIDCNEFNVFQVSQFALYLCCSR